MRGSHNEHEEAELTWGKNQNSSKDYKLHPQGQNKGIYKTTQIWVWFYHLLVQGLQITTKQGRRALGLSK